LLLVRLLFFLSSLGLIVIVLMQMSEHSGLGGAFGSGASSTVFGREDERDPKRTATSFLAAAFMLLGLLLSLM